MNDNSSMMKQMLRKGGLAACALTVACMAGAQTFGPVETTKPAFMKSVDAAAVSGAAGLNEMYNVESVKLGEPVGFGQSAKAAQPQGAARSLVRNSSKPGAYYRVQDGMYRLVPGFMLREGSTSTDYVVNEHGILGYIDRPVTFYNQSVGAESFYWDFLNQENLIGDSITTRPSFVTEGYVATPVLTAVSGDADSTYQLGRYVDTLGVVTPGMMALTGSAFVWNGSIEAEPFLNTRFLAFDYSNVWTSGVLFGTDTNERSMYMETYEAPAGGAVALAGAHFFVITPSTVDLASKRFSLHYGKIVDDKFEQVSSINSITPAYEQSIPEAKMRLWSVTGVPNDPIMMDGEFYMMVEGPQDGTQWVMYAQHDRALSADSANNTAWYVPTVGERAGIPSRYVLEGYNQSGEVVYSEAVCSALDVHQYMVTPYIMLAEGSQLTLLHTDTLNLSVNGQSRTFYLSDWYNTAESGAVTITATVSESSDGDWLTISQPGQATGGVSLDYFEFTIQASSLPFDADGRRATVTLADNLGFSRKLVIYQGDPAAADDALGVATVKASGEMKVVAEADGYAVTYPGGCTALRVYAASGQLVDQTALSSDGGTVRLSTAGWQKGVYVIQCVGNDVQTVKVMK